MFKPPGKDAGAEDSLEVVNDDFIAIDLKAGPWDINWLSETRNHQPVSSKLGSALEGGPSGRGERTRETERCRTRTQGVPPLERPYPKRPAEVHDIPEGHGFAGKSQLITEWLGAVIE
jgi:hypothetical protein